MKSGLSSKLCLIGPCTLEVAALECLKNSLKTYIVRNVVNTPASSLLIGSSLLLQETRTTIKAWMSSNFK